MNSERERWDTYTVVGRLLRTGVILSLVVLLFGLALAGIRGEYAGNPPPIWQLPSDLGRADTSAVISLGVLLLMLTPVARVVLTIFAFGRERDVVFVAVASIVMLNLVVGFVLGVT